MKENNKITKSNNQIVLFFDSPASREEVFDVPTAARLSGITARILMRYLKLGLVRPFGEHPERGLYFDHESIYLVRRAEYICQAMGINRQGAAQIVRLQREVEQLREELRFWRR